MPDVYLRKLAPFSGGINGYLREHFQTEGTVRANDLVLTNAAAAAIADRDVFTLHPQIELIRGRETEIAAELYRQIPDDFRAYQPPPPPEMRLPGGYGRLSNINEIMEVLAVVPEQQVQCHIQRRVIPVMMDDFLARYATGVTLDARLQQAWLSFSKMAMLAQRYPLEEVERRRERHALDGIFPGSLDLLAFIDVLTRWSPLMLTLPVKRHGTAWHFQTDAMWQLQAMPANGLVTESMSILSPLAKGSHQLGFQGLARMSAENIWRYLRFAVAGLNRLISFLNDPRSFLTEDGSADLLKSVQAYSAIHLLFADLQGVSFSTASHNRISYAMSAFDKFANLRVQVYPTIEAYSEEQAMRELATESQADELKRTLAQRFRDMNYDQLIGIFDAVIDRCYGDLHEHLRNQDREAATSEEVRLRRLRWQRNLRHGTFLGRNQFESLFFESDGTIPDAIGTLPLLLALGLIADPARFLRFRPMIAPAEGQP